MIRKISDSVIYIGTDDFSDPLFEGQYALPDGMAYNSYLIRDTKTAILDSTDARTAEAWRENLLEALAGAEPDFFVLLKSKRLSAAASEWEPEMH